MNIETHLNEEQLDDVLIGDPGPEVAAHLAECTACKAHVAALGAQIASFAAVSLAWSERRSVTAPPPVLATASSAWPRRMSWGLAASCLLMIGFAIPMARHEESASRATATNEPRQMATVSASRPVNDSAAAVSSSTDLAQVRVTTVADRSADAQIERDNQMLQAIDRELDASMQSPSDAFGAMAVGGRSNGHGRNAPALSWD